MTVSSDIEASLAVTRFGLGARPGELAAAYGDPQGWLLAQIRPQGADQPAGVLAGSRDRLLAMIDYRDQVKTLKAERAAEPAPANPETPPMSADAPPAPAPGGNFKAERKMAVAPLLEGVRDEMFARTVLAARTPDPFRERWTLFWANHFTVAASKLPSAVLAGPFEREAVRPHVFGRFEDLLVACTTHPGMLTYLDQARSAGPDSLGGRFRHMGLNENLAREVLELHTVGADAGYTQADVTEFARALTGYSLGARRDPPERQGQFFFRAQIHEPGERTVMGRRYADGGEGQARRVLADLATSPKTAERLSRKLAVHFVSDDPPPALVARLHGAWARSGGDLAVVARALVTAPEAWTPEQRKFKAPGEFLVSAYRAAGAAPRDAAKEVVQSLTVLGQRPLSAPQPNGWSDQATDWAAPDSVVKRLTWSARFAEVYAPTSLSPLDLADSALGARLRPDTRIAVARAETRPEAFAILLMSPEFQRR